VLVPPLVLLSRMVASWFLAVVWSSWIAAARRGFFLVLIVGGNV
jgi:hypothetical protein